VLGLAVLFRAKYRRNNDRDSEWDKDSNDEKRFTELDTVHTYDGILKF